MTPKTRDRLLVEELESRNVPSWSMGQVGKLTAMLIPEMAAHATSPSAAVDSFLKLDGARDKALPAATELTLTSFAKIECGLVGAGDDVQQTGNHQGRFDCDDGIGRAEAALSDKALSPAPAGNILIGLL